ncbi:type VI secretion system tube protein Hcp [Haloferula sp. BvORR071]|uniref:type VI secretion system tube protein Hcp n=1 Tax=Haloferula sp. BvORR071 TaxID=1396141 RepID=UPI000554CE66|nr:type VI secretion system tube protein Hcp [Haloferula sp. BvORR071]
MITRMLRALRKHAPAMAGAAVAVLWTGAALPAAGIDAFLKIESTSGQPVDTDADHSWVELLGFTQGVESEVTIGGATGGAGAGKVQGETCTLKLAQDRSLANLIDACTKGQARNVTLHVVREESGKYLMMTELRFEDAFVSAVKCSMAEGAEKPVFDVELEYVKVTWTVAWYENGPKSGKAQGGSFDFAQARYFGVPGAVPALGDYAGGTTPPNPDADGDGIPDAWEAANGMSGSNAADADLDFDQDGRANKEEYLAGTNPNSGASFFRMSASTAAPGQVSLTWNSVAGSSYKVWAAQTPDGSYTQVGTVTGVAGETSYATTLANGTFFKVTVGE